MAPSGNARKRVARFLPISISMLLVFGCGGPTKPALDLDSPPQGTDREQLRALMAQERPIFFETQEGERFYGEVRRTSAEDFELSEKKPFDGETAIPMSEKMSYRYADISRAQSVPEEGNSMRGLSLFMTSIVVGFLILGILYGLAMGGTL